MQLTPEEREVGKSNFYNVIGDELTRREFLERSIAAGMVSGAGLGAFYFGYQAINDPVRIGIIGTGDEGGVLIGALTPDYVQCVAIADIRPYNVHRAFHGDTSSDAIKAIRTGLMTKYGWSTEDEARKNVKVYQDYKDLLADPQIEGVIIALPLHLHAPVAIEAMKAGKHVLTEKLMGHSVHECKEMSRTAAATDKLLATGHQRHYSILYDNAVQTIRLGLLGDLHFIRAQWHRGNLPGRDSWSPPMIAELEKDLAAFEKRLAGAKSGEDYDAVRARKQQIELQLLDRAIAPEASKYGYEDTTLSSGYQRSAFEELLRWRLWNRTGGGLMAELGSHQLDAASIFISAMREDGKKVMPLNVSAVGGRYIFPHDRDSEDHVYCTYEFPAPQYDEKDPERLNKRVVVTYSSINGNGFGGYGEVVMGTKGTLILEREQEALLFQDSNTSTNIKVAKGKDGPKLDTTQSGPPAGASAGKKALDGPISRGYTEEIEHWAWCIRNRAPENQPKCHPKVALADAVIALTSNIAIRERRPVEFKEEWFDINSDETPEGVKPSVPVPA
ncbi:MAG: Gfo/Idh/MocA family oxidoreductase [Pirellulales bacterium]|nr:Gfo/Idh/MocA family oxidoreductase [Pirellulales bacterium]